MPHSIDLILTLTGGLAAALVLGFIAKKLRMSPIVGYLLAGIVVGPFTPGFVAHADMATQFAELGVILLMFGVGLHFHVKELLAVRRVALPGALLQIGGATGLGVLVTQAFGWSIGAGVVFGIAISVASTVVLLRVLSDEDQLHTRAGHIAIGWLIVEDLFTVIALVLLPVLADETMRGDTTGVVVSLGAAVLKIGALVVFTFVFGRHILPKLLGYVAATRSRELFTLTVLVLALGIAVGSATLFGASMALGAFLAGMIVGQSEFSTRAASEALPMRDAFAVLFFVSTGMLFDPARLVEDAALVGATLAVILVGKPVLALAVTLALRQPFKSGLIVAFALAQIGEFSFIVATLGQELKVIPDGAMQAIVAAAIVSITVNPLLFRLVGPLDRLWSRHRKVTVEAELPVIREDPSHRTIVVGYGPVGRTLVELVRENGIEPTVVELNHETIASLRAQGVRAVYGDAAQPEVLTQAGVSESASLVFAASGSPPEAVIRAAKELNPGILIMARATYVREVSALKQAGANAVVAAEAEVAIAMTERLLRKLGATPEQLDRARERVRTDLLEERVR